MTNISRFITTSALFLIALVGTSFAQTIEVTNTSQGVAARRQILAVKYIEGNQTTVNIAGTSLVPRATGKADVEFKRGRSRIKLEIDSLGQPQSLGSYTAYILWAVGPEGRAESLMQLPISGKLNVDATTEFQTFGLMITAEPHPRVALPSPVIVAENALRKGTEGRIEVSQIEYSGDPGTLKVPLPSDLAKIEQDNTRVAKRIEPIVVPVVGYADLHVHQFTNESMAGAWLYGSPTGPIETALARCSGNLPHTGGRHHGAFDKVKAMDIVGPVKGIFLSQIISEYAGADTGLHASRRHGYCQASTTPGLGLCRGNAACNLLGQSSCGPPPAYVCEWKSIGNMCRDKPGDGINVGAACNLVSSGRCNNTCSWSAGLCRGNLACNTLSKSQCNANNSNVCSMQSLSICRDRDNDSKNVGLACNILGQSACAATCSWDPSWGSITLHAENRAHDWTDRNQNNGDKASWPAWDAIAHQQVHTTWLRQAYQDGLRLMVMSALNNEAFCELLPEANRAPGYGCSDMENIVRQLAAAKALDADPSEPWYQIAYTAAQARNIINNNKLAVVLSVEASDIFNTADPAATLQMLYNMGARTLQPLHQFNSKLGGVATHDGSIKFLQTIKNLPSLHHLCKDNGGTGSYAKCDATKDQLNFLGLTTAGKLFVDKMLNLGMPVDIAHMSELSIKDVETIITAACDYPVYISHGHARNILDNEGWKAQKNHEKTAPDWELDLVKKTGGLFGLRTGADYYRADAYHAAMSAAGIATSLPTVGFVEMPGHTLGGNEFHFAYALDYLSRLKGVSVALGSDLNGLIPQMVFSGEDQDSKMAGLAHIGKLPTMFSKLSATGLDVGTYNHLRRDSAEAYLRMWEKAEAFATGTSCCPTPSVTLVTPNQAWYGRSNRVTITGADFTPHASMQVSVRATPTSAPIACTDVEFISSSNNIRCTMPPLSAGTWYYVTVRNGGCGLESTKQNAYFASPLDTGLVVDPSDPPFTQANLRTVLADEIPSNGWLEPNPEKIAAVDWTHPAWDGASTPTRNVPGDRPLEDGFPQKDWDAARTSPSRLPISPVLDVLLGKEDAALMIDPITMIAACDMEEPAKSKLAAANGWPADWRAQMDSLCNWRNNICTNDTQRPTIGCPTNITAATATINDMCAVATFAPATSDNCPGVTVACNPPSGSCFPAGTTTVTCTATDASGNTATCSFTVTVNVGFNVCLRDDSNPNTVFLGNSVTGAYRFCCGGATFTGIAQVTKRGNIATFQQNGPDRRVFATTDGGVFKGSASLQSPPGTTRCTIADRDTRNNSCVCQ